MVCGVQYPKGWLQLIGMASIEMPAQTGIFFAAISRKALGSKGRAPDTLSEIVLRKKAKNMPWVDSDLRGGMKTTFLKTRSAQLAPIDHVLARWRWPRYRRLRKLK
jgi:hypothetical protein